MSYRYIQMTSTPAVRAARQRYGGAGRYDSEGEAAGAVPDTMPDTLGEAEVAFIEERDGFYLASVSETGWPYVQFRGGPRGFLRVLDSHTLGFADFRGNRQYITAGNVAADDRVSLFLMDYAHRRRLKILGHARVIDATDGSAAAKSLAIPGYPGRIERSVLLTVEAFDWNCQQHITPRFTEAELASIIAPEQRRLETLQAENQQLRRKLASNVTLRGRD
jgi:predicted pyridoxine 5'-phosphate oxidase superfamily flavin-nucleotide-binding protein